MRFKNTYLALPSAFAVAGITRATGVRFLLDPLVKNLVGMHGGTVEAHAEGRS